MSEIEQGSPEWFALRCGKVTASRVADVVAKTKTGWGASRANYMAELVAEQLTQTVAPGFQNDAMRWGTEQEPLARSAYEFRTDAEIAAVGFIAHPTIPMSGASPDGHIGEDGSLEIKCPNTATHLDTLLGQAVPAKYITQIQWQLACNGRKWCDFVSFDPRMPENMRIFIQRVDRDDKLIKELEEAVVAFIFELDGKVTKLRDRYEQKAEAA